MGVAYSWVYKYNPLSVNAFFTLLLNQKDKPDADVLLEIASYYDVPLDTMMKRVLEVSNTAKGCLTVFLWVMVKYSLWLHGGPISGRLITRILHYVKPFSYVRLKRKDKYMWSSKTRTQENRNFSLCLACFCVCFTCEHCKRKHKQVKGDLSAIKKKRVQMCIVIIVLVFALIHVNVVFAFLCVNQAWPSISWRVSSNCYLAHCAVSRKFIGCPF